MDEKDYELEEQKKNEDNNVIPQLNTTKIFTRKDLLSFLKQKAHEIGRNSL